MVAEWYGAYTRSAHWKRVKAQRKAGRSRTCEICGKRKHTVVHHKTYERLGREAQEDLQLLCHKCHKALHVQLLHRKSELPGIWQIRFPKPPVDLVPLLPMSYVRKVLKRGSWL